MHDNSVPDPIQVVQALLSCAMTIRIGLVTGEYSGDILGANLIRALSRQYSGAVHFEGIAGPAMQQAGCRAILPMEAILAGGLTEILRRLPQLWYARQKVIRYFLKNPPDVFIGIDAPDFNLGIEHKLKKSKIKTVHYVSPTVWAWREKRIFKIAKSVDLMLTLFPFEAKYYEAHHIPVHYVGHPLADKISEPMDKQAARQILGLSDTAEIIAVLPGTRSFEIQYLGRLFLDTLAWCLTRKPDLRFIVPMISQTFKKQFECLLQTYPQKLPLEMMIGEGASHSAMAAADVVLMASGTATLESMLMNRPMVVAYRLSPLTYRILIKMVKVSFCAIPNLLANRFLVPEFIQQNATPEHLGRALLEYLAYPEETARLMLEYQKYSALLRQNANENAAKKILELTY